MSLSKNYLELIEKAKKLSKTNLDVLIIGENGAGKHWLLSHITGESEIEKVDCKEWRSNLNILSKIVVHKVNIFQFSYIDNLDPEGQLVLLRTLEKRELIFNECSFKVKRLYFTSHPSIKDKVNKGEFREDLFKKISSIQLSIPALRDRKDDIPYYVEIFLSEICKKFRKKIPQLSDGFVEFLYSRTWEGNLTELKSLLESMILFGKGRTLEIRNIPEIYKAKPIVRQVIPVVHGIKLDEYEKEIIRANLLYFEGNRKKTAEVLGISERNLYRKINLYNLEMTQLQ